MAAQPENLVRAAYLRVDQHRNSYDNAVGNGLILRPTLNVQAVINVPHTEAAVVVD